MGKGSTSSENNSADTEASPEAKAGLDFAAWLLAVPVLIYATGFLVVFTAEERLGLVSTSGDFFKIKYMHVGVLCATFVGLFAGLAYVHRELTFEGKSKKGTSPDESARHDIKPTQLLAVVPTIAGIYVQLTITPPGSFWGWPAFTLVAFALVTFVGALALQGINRDRRDHLARRMWIAVSGLLGVAYLVAEILTVEWQRWEGAGKGALSVTMLALFAAVIGRVLHRSAQGARGAKIPGKAVVWWFIGASVAGFFYYVAAYGFALAIYPHISIRKGGGDYCDAPDAVVYFVEPAEDSVPAAILDGPHRTKPLVLLLETGEVIYAAEDSKCERCLWGKSAEDRPIRIFQFSRSSVSVVEIIANPTARPGPSGGGSDNKPRSK